MSDHETVRPTKERMGRVQGFDELTEVSPGGVTRKTGAIRVWSNVENLYRNNRITSEQCQAANKFYADWWIGTQSGKYTTMRWSEYISGLGVSGDMDAAERRVFHSKRFAQANKLLDELGLREATHWLVINDVAPAEIGRVLWGYKNRDSASASGVVLINVALQRLKKFYGL
jgi:hypothetical protein